MDVIEIHKDHVMAVAGEPWPHAVSQSHALGAKMVEIQWGSVQKERPDRPPAQGSLGLLPHLAVDHAWLRQVDGRAFLYLENF